MVASEFKFPFFVSNLHKNGQKFLSLEVFGSQSYHIFLGNRLQVLITARHQAATAYSAEQLELATLRYH